MNKLYLDVSDVIHANEHTVCVNCGLRGSFWDFLLMSFCFMMKNNHVKQKLLLWSQVLLKIVIVITWFRTCWFECTWFVDFFESCSRRNNGSYNFSFYSIADAPVLNVNETAHTQGAIFTPTISAWNSHIDIPVMTQLPNNQNLSN